MAFLIAFTVVLKESASWVKVSPCWTVTVVGESSSLKKPASKLLSASPSMSSKFWLLGVELSSFVCVLKGLAFSLACWIYLVLICSTFSITVKVSASLPSGLNMKRYSSNLAAL